MAGIARTRRGSLSRSREEDTFLRAPAKRARSHAQSGHSKSEGNVSVAAGAIATLLGLSRRSFPGLLVAGVGSALLYRGMSTKSETAERSRASEDEKTKRLGGGQSTEEIAKNGFRVQEAFTINRSPEELYSFWRNFENLPRFMSYLESVRIIDDRRSHWVTKAPGVSDKTVEWDSEIVKDEPNRLIAWRSLPGADIANTGQVTFDKGLGDRGTIVRVIIDYVPPAGRVGKWIATLFGESPDRQVREDLRNFKRVIEIGEAITTVGQTRGTRTGKGKYEKGTR